jgi:sulfhydrogenase subunit beta (sulfur reductase)
METCFLSRDNLSRLLEDLEDRYQVYFPAGQEAPRFYARRDDAGTVKPPAMVVGEVRAAEPLKSFYFPARERVAAGFEDTLELGGRRPACIVGAKACDLRGLKVLDQVFAATDPPDPFYAARREDNLVISADCTTSIDTCFCLALQVDPFPRESFDLNLSEVSGGFLVAAGSPRGQAIARAGLFSEATRQQVAERDAQRRRVAREVKARIKALGVPDQPQLAGAVQRSYSAGLWQEEAETCVECGACNTVCPTCHCFLLYDQQSEQDMARLRVWDSCLIKDFARVAGGANPRPRLWMRLRNRFEKKFDFFPKRYGLTACTGCGRCVSACPAGIDIRKVLKRLVDHV